ncbi:MAG: hypothetical protein ACLRWM_15950 [Streptococcus sp.]
MNLNKHMTEGMRFRNKLAYDLIREFLRWLVYVHSLCICM